MAGYSGRSLVNKLGIKNGYRIRIDNAPENYEQTLGDLPANVIVAKRAERALNLVQFFTQSRDELAMEFPNLKNVIAYDGMIWISWPKKAAKTDTT